MATAQAATTAAPSAQCHQASPVGSLLFIGLIGLAVWATVRNSQKDAIAEDNALFEQESIWIDTILPFEFKEADDARASGDENKAIERTLEGISRLYSDQAIEKWLKSMESYYPKAASLLESYRTLVKLRDESNADEKSLEKLRKKRDAWQEDLLTIG